MKKKIIIAFCIGIVLYIGCSLLPDSTEFDDKATLEDVMEMSLPNYKVKRYVADNSFDIHGDFIDTIFIEFDNIPSKAFIDSVNHKVDADKEKSDKRWLKEDEHQYRFQAMYGDGGRTPKCREKANDWFINFEFSDNSKEGIIEYGHW